MILLRYFARRMGVYTLYTGYRIHNYHFAVYGAMFPAPYPVPGLVLANQIATLGVQEGWVADYTRATYRRWFESGESAGEEPNISNSLEEIGCDPSQVLAAAKSERIISALATATDEAMELGVFGSPTFVVDGEVFWGDDRLDDALHWSKGN